MATSKVKIRPLGDRVLVKQDEAEEKTAGGIYLPDAVAKDAPQWGTIIRTGTGKVLENGETRALSVKEGDKIIFGKYSGTKVKMDSEELLFMREEDIMAVVE